LFVTVAETKFDKLDGVEICIAKTPGKLGDTVAILRSCHAAIDFAEKGNVGIELLKRRGDGIDMTQSLDVPE
jgi:hypothetical protein